MISLRESLRVTSISGLSHLVFKGACTKYVLQNIQLEESLNEIINCCIRRRFFDFFNR